MSQVSSKAVWGAAVALWLIAAPAVAQYEKKPNGKVDRALADNSGPGSRGSRRVIIRTKPGAKLEVRKKVQARGGGIVADHRLVDAVTANVRAEDVAALAASPDVESISIDAPVSASGGSRKGRTSTSTSSSPGDDEVQYSISVLKQSLGLGNWFPGSSVTVALIDSGLAPLADFQGRIAGFHDFTNGRNGEAVAAYDDFGHGTHVAGLIGSSGASSSNKYAGVAPGVKFLALKVLDKKGSGHTSNVIKALEFVVANKARHNIRVVNLSLGHPVYESAATDPLVQAVEAAVRAGLVVVTAAGNCGINPATGLPGYGGIASPGNAPSAITVGAGNTKGTLSRADDRVAGYSSRGPSWYDGLAKPDILAPGQAMISNEVDGSTLAIQYPELITQVSSSKFLKLNGSSMATGVVSGLAAIMIEANQWGAYMRWSALQETLRKNERFDYVAPPALTSNAIKAMLQYSATPIADDSGARYDALTQGTGLVNGLGAIALAYYADTTRGAGSFWLTTTLPPVSDFGGTDAVWSESMIWGTRLVSGSSIVELNQSAWADNIVWGTGEMDDIVWGTVSEYGDNIVWGTALGSVDVVWAGNANWGDNLVWGTLDWADNIVWGTGLLGFFDGDNIVWGTLSGDNIVWGTLSDDNIVWGTNDNKVTILGSSLIGGGL